MSAAKLAVADVIIGIATGVALTQLVAHLLFGVSAHDPLTFAAVSGLLFVIAILACYIPARRAISVNPVVTLHYE